MDSLCAVQFFPTNFFKHVNLGGAVAWCCVIKKKYDTIAHIQAAKNQQTLTNPHSNQTTVFIQCNTYILFIVVAILL
jgi:hypothetical protein